MLELYLLQMKIRQMLWHIYSISIDSFRIGHSLFVVCFIPSFFILQRSLGIQ